MNHKQWLLRNTKVHIKRTGDLNAEEHNKLLIRIQKLIWTDPDGVLPGNKHLLKEDFEILGKTSALGQKLWVAEMEASTAAADHERKANKVNKSDKEHNPKGARGAIVTKSLNLTGKWGSEGSSVWKRKHWK